MDAVFQKVALQSHPHFDTQVINIPGILAYSQDQFAPLMPVFRNTATDTIGLNYAGERFYANACATAIRRLVEDNLKAEQKTLLFASSLGGMLTANALMQLSHWDKATLNRFVSTIIVDSPASGEDLVLAPPVPSWVNPGGAWLFNHFRPRQKSNDGYGKKLLNSFRVPPKDGEIELVDGGLTADEIKHQAIQGLSGHLFTMWYGQVKWMLNTTLDLSSLDGLDITYIACTANNVTVRQPQASQAWRPHVRRVIEVPTPHCAYLQAQPTWTTTLGPLVRQLVGVK